ncbi:MAG: hypothetical protein GVY18_03400 [Bacteroidetes bacterium]|jgi:hypothetical protein|nr:hypothetical protein [Bacteroidota bacterium]
MADTPSRDLDLSDIFGLIISNQATTRARFKVIMQTMARILAHLEARDEDELLAELMEHYETERGIESETLKAYFRQAHGAGDDG